MLCFYDLSEVSVIVFPAISQNFRNEVVPPSSEREVCVVQLSCLVFPVCFSSKPCTSVPKACHFNGAWQVLWCLNTKLCAGNILSFLVAWLIFFFSLEFLLHCIVSWCLVL